MAARKQTKRRPTEPCTPQDVVQVERSLERAFAASARKTPMTAARRLERDRRIMDLLAMGLTVETVAGRVGLTSRHVLRIKRAWRDMEAAMGTPPAEEVLEDALAVYERAIEKISLLAEDAEHEGTKLGAYRSLMEGVKAKIELLQVMGRVPRSLAAAGEERDFSRLIARVIDHLEGQLPPEKMRELADVISLDDARTRKAS